MPANGQPNLLEKLIAETNPDPDVDTSEFTASGLIRRRLLLGETLYRDATMREYGVSRSLLDQVATTMRKLGWESERITNEAGEFGVRLTAPDQPIDEARVRAYMAETAKAGTERNRRAREAAKRAEAAKAKARREREAAKRAEAVEAPAPPVAMVPHRAHGQVVGPDDGPPDGLDRFPAEAAPLMDSDLRVYLVARNMDGTMTVGLRNGSRAWIATLTGVTAVEA